MDKDLAGGGGGGGVNAFRISFIHREERNFGIVILLRLVGTGSNIFVFLLLPPVHDQEDDDDEDQEDGEEKQSKGKQHEII